MMMRQEQPGSGLDEASRRRALSEMVLKQIELRGVREARVLEAMRSVPRDRFVLPDQVGEAFVDHPLTIGHGQTISQPYIVAFMTQALELKPKDRVLEIGTGSGYQTAVLAHLAHHVFSIEVVPELAVRAKATLQELGLTNVTLRNADGFDGWPEAAPFDAILLAAAPEEIPDPLVQQLAPGGRLIAPVGGGDQDLVLVRREEGGALRETTLMPVRFVPMTGRARR